MSANKIVYLVAEPGFGKSTAMTLATARYPRFGPEGQPKREWLIDKSRPVAVELGARVIGKCPDGYPGTDAMSMSAIVGVDEWLRSGQAAQEADLILGEGARLGVRRFLDAALASGWYFTLIYGVDPEGAAQRRKERGSEQAESWVRGAATRAQRFYEYAQERAVLRSSVCAHTVTTPREMVEAIAAESGLEAM